MFDRFVKLSSDIKAEIITYLKCNDVVSLLKVYKVIKIDDSLWLNVINILKLNCLLKRTDKQNIFKEQTLDYYDIYMKYLQNKDVYWEVVMTDYKYFEDVMYCDADMFSCGYDSGDYSNKHDDFFVIDSLKSREDLNKIITRLSRKIYYNFIRYKFYEIKTDLLKNLPLNNLFDGTYTINDSLIKYIIYKCSYTKQSIINMENKHFYNFTFIVINNPNYIIEIISEYIKSKLIENFDPKSLTCKNILQFDDQCKIKFNVQRLND